jgi:hypothetical protein
MKTYKCDYCENFIEKAKDKITVTFSKIFSLNPKMYEHPELDFCSIDCLLKYFEETEK